MKKRLVSVVVALMMMLQLVPFVQAADWTDSVVPDLDMEIKSSGAAVFENGPLYITGSGAHVDLKTTLYMQKVRDTFTKWYTTALNVIHNMAQLDNTLNENDMKAQLDALKITGQFTVEILFPDSIVVPDDVKTGTNMQGFNAEALTVFEETVPRVYDEANGKIIITIDVRDTITAGPLFANINTYLADLNFTANNVTIPEPGTYTATGTLTGHTKTEGANVTIGSKVTSLIVDYNGTQLAEKANPSAAGISATVVLSAPTGSGGTSSSKYDKIIFNVDGVTDYVEPMVVKGKVTDSDLPVPEKPGYSFVGWYYDSEYKNEVKGLVDVKSPGTVLYGHWVNDSLNSEDHFAYVIGYPDGTVKPQNNISREEIVTIFYRLLREEKLVSIVTDENNFSDVEKDRWSNKAISTMTNGGYIKGYEDGTFGPSKPITRAEFATIATRYATLTDKGNITFTDIAGHWAEENVYKASGAGWVQGYEDGTFGPELYITRAEAMTIINRMLTRHVDKDGIHADTKLWSDMTGDEWYYYNVIEATNSHDYVRRADGKLEKWTAITPNRIWIELETMENPS